MTRDELVDELMDLVEARSLSGLLRAVAERCRNDRVVLTRGLLLTDADAMKYLSEEENLLTAASEYLEKVERDSYDDEGNKKKAT